MSANAEVARGWFAKADSDFTIACLCVDSAGPFDTVCFHCQQVVEKYMKGFIAFHNRGFPFTHDLSMLADICGEINSALQLADPMILQLTRYAVELRYNTAFWPTKEEAREALKIARGVRDRIRMLMPNEALQ